MKALSRRVLLRVLLLLCLITSAQAQSSVSWSIKTNSVTSALKAGDKLSAQINATIDLGWHLYSITQGPGGPNPTKITVPEGQSFKLSGNILSPKPVVKMDQNFGIQTETYEQSAEFTVPVVVAPDSKAGQQSSDHRP